jgi:hypothetical protein
MQRRPRHSPLRRSGCRWRPACRPSPAVSRQSAAAATYRGGPPRGQRKPRHGNPPARPSSPAAGSRDASDVCSDIINRMASVTIMDVRIFINTVPPKYKISSTL